MAKCAVDLRVRLLLRECLSAILYGSKAYHCKYKLAIFSLFNGIETRDNFNVNIPEIEDRCLFVNVTASADFISQFGCAHNCFITAKSNIELCLQS